MCVEQMLWHYNIHLPTLWTQLAEGTCHWVPVGTAFLLYVRRKYNSKRCRWELELISLTPSRYIHTQNRTYAQPLASLNTQR